jgi:hypothetical protein
MAIAMAPPPYTPLRRNDLLTRFAEPVVIILAYLLFVGLVLSGVISFVAWQQVEDLHYARVALEVLYGHPHFARYLIARPGLMLSDTMGPVGFSFYVANFAALSVLLMYLLLRGRNWLLILLACLSIFAIQLFMNGRGAISWFGWMAILWLIFEPGKLRWFLHLPLLFFALLCTSVSSGTFSVAFVSVFGIYLHRLRKNGIWYTAAVSGALIYAYYGLFMEGVQRNLSYYALGTRSPIVNMLRHGFGDVILNNPVLVVTVVTVLFLAVGALILALRVKPQVREVLVLIVPLGGGIFGYTTLSLLLPSLIVVVSRRAAGLVKSRD